MASSVSSSVTFQRAVVRICETFNIRSLYPEQEECLKELLGGKNVYASLPTGYGKSVIFYAASIVADQVFERTRGSSKIVIISPLKTLMEDQVAYLKSLGLSAIALHDEQSEEILEKVEKGNFTYLFASPEKMLSVNRWCKLMSSNEYLPDFFSRGGGGCTQSVIAKQMTYKVYMSGTVNGHYFEVEGDGKGKPYEGEQTVKLTVTKGGPLPFAWDILSPLSQYGSIPFTKYPEDIPDYVKQSFPEGYTWERIMNFEDGAVCTVSNDSSIQGNCFIYNVKISGVNFPPNGPVMQKKTQGWEPNTERLFARDGMLIGNNFMALKLEGGGHYLCEFKSTYKAKKPVRMPGYHYVDRKLDVTSHNKDYTSVEQCEISIARHSLLG